MHKKSRLPNLTNPLTEKRKLRHLRKVRKLRPRQNSQLKKKLRDLKRMMMPMMKMLFLQVNFWSKLKRERLNIRRKKPRLL